MISGKANGELLWSIEKKYGAKKLPDTTKSFGRTIDVFVKSIGRPHPSIQLILISWIRLWKNMVLKRLK